MQLPKQGPALRRNRRLHPSRGRFASLAGVTPSQELDMDDMDDMGDMDDDGGDDGDDGYDGD